MIPSYLLSLSGIFSLVFCLQVKLQDTYLLFLTQLSEKKTHWQGWRAARVYREPNLHFLLACLSLSH